MMKKIVLICTLLILFVGCNNWNLNDSRLKQISHEPTIQYKTEIKIMLPGSQDIRSDISQRLESKLRETYPDIDFDFEYVSNYWDYVRSMNAMGNLPDIFYADSRELIIPLIESGSVLNLKPYITKDGFINKYNLDMTIKPHTDGGIYSLQSGADTYFCSTLFYNKEIFKALELKLPEDMDEFYATCEQLKLAGYIPLTTSMQDGWAIESILIPQYIASKDPGKILDIVNIEVNMANDPIVIESLEMLTYLRENNYLPINQIRLTYGESQALFIEHEAAMYTMYSWAAGNLSDDPAFDVMPWPTSDKGMKRENVATVWGSQYSGYLVSSSMKDKSLGVEMIEMMALEEARFFNEDQKIPTSLYTGVDIQDQPYLVKQVLKQIEEADLLLPSYKLFIFSPETIEIHSDLLLKVFVGDMIIEEYVKEFGPVWEENLRSVDGQ